MSHRPFATSLATRNFKCQCPHTGTLARSLHVSSRRHQGEADQGSSRPRTQREVNRRATQQLQELGGPRITRVYGQQQSPGQPPPLDRFKTDKPQRNPQRNSGKSAPRAPAQRLRPRSGGSRGGSAADGVDEDGDEDPEELKRKLLNVSPDIFLEEYAGDDFHNEKERENYEYLIKLMAAVNVRTEEAEKMAAQGQNRGDEAKIVEAEAIQKEVDEMVRHGLRHLDKTRDEVLAPHVPQDHSLDHYATEVGDVPVGKDGMGTVVEDGVQWLTGREGQKWVPPRTLAQRLANGQLVKFNSRWEKGEANEAWVHIDRQRHTGKDAVKFMPLEQESRQDLVKDLVGGSYKDPEDADLSSDLEKNVARMISGHYPPQAKATVLETLRGLTPAGRGRRPERQAQ